MRGNDRSSRLRRPNVDFMVPGSLKDNPDTLQKARLLILISFTGFIWGPVFAPIHYFIGRTPSASMALLVAGLSTILVPFLLRATESLTLATNALCGILLCIVIEVTVVRGGYPVSALIWSCAIPLLALLIIGRKAAVIWGLTISALLVGLGLFTLWGPGFQVRMTESQMLIIDMAGVTAYLMAVVTIMWLYDEERRKTMARIESANRAKSEFLARMSHEIRTPMNGVLGTIDLLMATELTAGQKNYLGLIRRSGQDLLRIIAEILEFSRIERGSLGLEKRAFDPEEEIREVVNLLEPQATDKELDLSFEMVGPAPARLVGDPGRLRQVLMNLVSNAIKFTPTGEVRLVAKVEAGDDDGFVLSVDVHDTGIGIEAEDMERVFDAFAQVDERMSREYGGGGLGLSISSELVELMGGRLTASSENGKGSTFSFSIPLESSESGTGPVESDDAAPPATVLGEDSRSLRGRRHILLAEDNPVNKQVTLAMLRGLGYHTDVASNGREALELVRRHRYDLVLMDCQMPEMDGYQATAQMRTIPGTSSIPIVALTAHALAGDRQDCLAAGMNDYLSKPIVSADLEAVLSRWIR